MAKRSKKKTRRKSTNKPVSRTANTSSLSELRKLDAQREKLVAAAAGDIRDRIAETADALADLYDEADQIGVTLGANALPARLRRRLGATSHPASAGRLGSKATGTSSPSSGKRGRRGGVREGILTALSSTDGPMSPGELGKHLIETGATKSQTPGTIASHALATLVKSGHVKKTGRGQFTIAAAGRKAVGS